jgi:hypothetical protein
MADKGGPAKVRAMAMTVLRGGSTDHLPALTARLDDKTEACLAPFALGPVNRTQVRDLVLGVSLWLAGEREEDYGLGNRRRAAAGQPDGLDAGDRPTCYPTDRSCSSTHRACKTSFAAVTSR